ncbi:MAG: flagellar hook-basal body complex protein FliE [Proteobacteria bacterium]|nr:flagellar hook-basal body complex protein FliE [Pseudomonadota bacterium]
MIESLNALNNRISIKDQGPSKTVLPDRDFSDRFKDLLRDVNDKQHQADEDSQKVIKGELGIHEGMLSMAEADISLRYLVQVRAKVMQAYNEIIKMQI